MGPQERDPQTRLPPSGGLCSQGHWVPSQAKEFTVLREKSTRGESQEGGLELGTPVANPGLCMSQGRPPACMSPVFLEQEVGLEGVWRLRGLVHTLAAAPPSGHQP